MAVSHRTNRLKVIGNPSVEQLQNGRYRMTFNMTPLNPRNDWYNANKSRIFADFGTLESAEMSVDGIPPRTGEAYDDMRLVAVEAGNRSRVEGGDYIVQFVYETLGDTFVQVKDDTVDYELNGLRRVTRESIAEAGTDFQKTVGTTSISSQIDTETAVTCILASYQVDDTDSYRKVTETYIEAGTISRTEDFVGSQDSLVLETIGADPATPSGFSLASKQESNFQGYQTNRFTFLKNDVQLSQSEDKVGSQLAISQQWFNPDADKTLAGYSLASKNTSDFEGIETVEFRFLKDNVVLSESEDKVGSQLSITKEVFNGTPATPSGYSIANEQESNVDGIPTRRFTFLKNNTVLSVTQDKVGSQKAIVNQVFNPTTYDFGGVDEDNVALTGYVEASRQVSDFEGIKTVRYTFLEPSVLFVDSDYDSGQSIVIAQSFNLNETETTTQLGLGSDFFVIQERQSDFEGIKTHTFTYEAKLYDVIDYELNGLKRVTRTELAITNFSEQTIGTEHPSLTGLYIASQDIDNGGDIKRRVTVVIEAGTLAKEVRTIGDGVRQTTQQDLVTAPTISAGNYVISEDIDNFGGLQRFTTSFISKSDGTTLTESDGGEKLAFEYEKLVPFTFPGVVSLQKVTKKSDGTLDPPVEATVKADIYTYYQTSSDIVDGDFTKESSLGLWNPSTWAKKTSSVGSFRRSAGGVVLPAYNNTQTFRGYRVRETISVSGNTGVPFSPYEIQNSSSQEVTINLDEINFEEDGTSGGKPLYKAKPFVYVYDTGRLETQSWSAGGPASGSWQGTSATSYTIRLRVDVQMIYSGTRWELQYKSVEFRNDPDSFTSSSTDTSYKVINSSRLNEIFDNDQYRTSYTKPTGIDQSTYIAVKQAALGNESFPYDATWDSDLLVEETSQEEVSVITSSSSATINTIISKSNDAAIEGRSIDPRTHGITIIEGGPPNPLNQKYTLDVNVKKAFTDKDGTDVFQKQIVIATCTPVGDM